MFSSAFIFILFAVLLIISRFFLGNLGVFLTNSISSLYIIDPYTLPLIIPKVLTPSLITSLNSMS